MNHPIGVHRYRTLAILRLAAAMFVAFRTLRTVSVPFQFDWQNGIGPLDQTQYILNIQPVMPFSVSDSTNLIVRVIAPIVSQPPIVAGGVPASGVSDVLASFFLSPKKSPVVWCG